MIGDPYRFIIAWKCRAVDCANGLSIVTRAKSRVEGFDILGYFLFKQNTEVFMSYLCEKDLKQLEKDLQQILRHSNDFKTFCNHCAANLLTLA